MSGRFYAFIRDGVVEDVGEGSYTLQPGQAVMEFETEKARALDPLVAEYELRQALPILKKRVQDMKSEHAYAGKEYDARKLLAFTVDGALPAGFAYVADDYPHLDLEVQAQGCTPLEAANDIVMAVLRTEANDKGTLALESDRIALREQIKQIEAL